MLVKKASAVNATDKNACTNPLFPENNLKSGYTYCRIFLINQEITRAWSQAALINVRRLIKKK